MTNPVGIYQALCLQGPGKMSIRNSQWNHCFRLAHNGAITTLTKVPSLLKVPMRRCSLMVVMSIPRRFCNTQHDSLYTLFTDHRLNFSMVPLMGQYSKACQPRYKKWKLTMRMMNSPTSTVLLFFGSLI